MAVCGRSPLLPKSAWDQIYTARYAAVQIVGILLLAVFLALCAMDTEATSGKRERLYYLLIIFAVSSLINTIMSLIAVAADLRKEGLAGCVDNAVAYSAGETIGDNSICPSQAVILVYTLLVNAVCCMLIGVDLLLTALALLSESAQRFIWHAYVALIVLLPLISVLIQSSLHEYGYSSPSPFCLDKVRGTSHACLPVYWFSSLLTCLFVLMVILHDYVVLI